MILLTRNIEEYRPKYIARSVASINFRTLAKDGIHYLIIDLDGTLAAALSMVLCIAAVKNILLARHQELVLDVCICSNAWLYPFAKRVERIARACGFKCHACFWPRPAKPRHEAFEAAMATMPGATKENTVVIGDQLNTDIRGANLAGIRSLWVPILGPVPWWKSRRVWSQTRMLRALGINMPATRL